MYVTKRILVGLLVAGSFVMRTDAAPLLMDMTGGVASTNTGGVATLGFSFTLQTAQTVTSLGLFDAGSDGLGESHDVGLWTSTGTLLASAVVDNASSPEPSAHSGGRWLFTDVPDLLLPPGDYVLGAFFRFLGPDSIVSGANAPTMANGALFGEGRSEGFSETLAFPGFPAPDSFASAFFGPNAQLEASPVPEPLSAALVVTGLSAIGAMRLRRRSR